jgi:hypothetical protein
VTLGPRGARWRQPMNWKMPRRGWVRMCVAWLAEEVEAGGSGVDGLGVGGSQVLAVNARRSAVRRRTSRAWRQRGTRCKPKVLARWKA